MKLTHISKKLGASMRTLAAVAGILVAGSALLGSTVAAADTAATTHTKLATAEQTRTQTIISKGDQEIVRRLTTLSKLTAKINATTKLSASDKATLSAEVSSTTSGLTSLKAKLDADTTATDARTDAKSIYTEYRVYALVVPKVHLIKVADDQQVVQGKLTSLAQKLQTRITSAQQAGKDVAALQTQLDDMNAKIAAAQKISSTVESTVITLQPTDYNNDHAVLSGYSTQLISAHNDDKAAVTDAKSIVSALKKL